MPGLRIHWSGRAALNAALLCCAVLPLAVGLPVYDLVLASAPGWAERSSFARCVLGLLLAVPAAAAARGAVEVS